MRTHLVLFLFVLFFLAGCSEAEKLSENATIAKNYLSNEGFKVISHESDGWQAFSESDLLKLPNEQVWAVQYIEPDKYLNKRIDTKIGEINMANE